MKNYNANQVNVSIAGKALTGGFTEDTFFIVRRTTPSFTTKVGADGEVVRSRTNDKRGEFEIHLMASSSDNDFLSALMLLDENTENGAGIGALLVDDKNGTSLHSAVAAWLTEWPEADFGREAGERVWKGEIEDLKQFIGGY